MPGKLRWGVLGAARIATVKVIPAMQQGRLTEVTAICSREKDKAQHAANSLGIAKAYGSYEELLADPEIDAVYNPLPNHLHVPWSIRAAEAGKHVLCEKPVSLNAAECRTLIAARDRTGVKIGEAFMIHTHPQWLRARELARSGELGQLRAITVAFSYFNRDPANVRNRPEWGGGGLLDIGCYAVHASRFLFGAEPRRVAAVMEHDPQFGVDRLASAILDYEEGQCTFTCSMQMVPYQRVQLLGTKARLEIEIPFNAPPDRACRLIIDPGQDVFGSGSRVETLPVCNQYTIQGDEFARAVIEESAVPVPLEDSLRNMAVLDALVRSAASQRWEEPETF